LQVVDPQVTGENEGPVQVRKISRILSEVVLVPPKGANELRASGKVEIQSDAANEIRRNLKKPKCAKCSCWANVQRVQNGVHFHMMPNQPKLWNCANFIYWNDVQREKNAFICTRAFPANTFILVIGTKFQYFYFIYFHFLMYFFIKKKISFVILFDFFAI
jgi:hypothetical protein